VARVAFRPLAQVVSLWAVTLCLQAQVNIRDSVVRSVVFAPTGSFYLPMASLHNRTGLFYGVGGSIFYKTSRNFYWEISGAFLTGNRIREKDALMRLATDDGFIIAQDGGFADVRLLFRGWEAFFSLGKQIVRIGPNPNCGLYLKAGLGWMGHKIRIEVQNNNVPALQGDYIKGYDRLRAGLGLSQEIGYIFFSNNKRLTFRTALFVNEAFTRSLRGFNYDSGLPDEQAYTDVVAGLRLAWLIAAYIRPAEVYYTR
jgi:hypothetical protein